MVIGLRAGHAEKVRGASGVVDEWATMNRLYPIVVKYLNQLGHRVIDCNPYGATTVSGELSQGVAKANAQAIDLFCSLHMNAYNGSAHGTECWIYSTSSKSKPAAQRIVANLASMGLTNRGVKTSTKYYDLRNTKAPAIIIETGFCDNAGDANLINHNLDKVARLIAEGITGQPISSPNSSSSSEYIITKGSYKNGAGRNYLYSDAACTDRYKTDIYLEPNEVADTMGYAIVNGARRYMVITTCRGNSRGIGFVK